MSGIKIRNQKPIARPAVPEDTFSTRDLITALILGVLFFFVVCLCAAETVRVTTLVLIVLMLAAGALRFSVLRERFGPVLLALTLLLLMCGISTFYAIAGKFALRGFLQMFCAFCLAMILTAFAPRGLRRGARWMAVILATAMAMASLVSIDLLSTRLFSGAVLAVLRLFAPTYDALTGVEAGVRMNSVFTNPNTFAGCVGLGTLLSLGLTVSAGRGAERRVCCVLLSLNALGFLLAFSMGASIAIFLAFLVYLLLEAEERRSASFVLMLETLVITAAAAAVVSATSFDAWSGLNAIPLLCAVCAAAALSLADQFPGKKLETLPLFRGKNALILIAVLVIALGAFAAAAWTWTGGITLNTGDTLRRAVYPAPGEYTLQIEADAPLDVTVESQNREDTMMHTSSVLYRGEASGAAFTVPEDSMVVYFNFSAPDADAARLESAALSGAEAAVKLPLGYRLLPGFIANRLQGLLANQNAIQRLVFFEDGLKLFRRSPIIGLGMGAYECAIKSVQSFNYETKFAHNHYIQSLAETGIIGLLLFLSLFAAAVAALVPCLRKRGQARFLAPLGAAVVFMAIHGAVEVVFSAYAYLPIAYGVFALINLCCPDSWPRLKVSVRTVSLLGLSVFSLFYGIVTLLNATAPGIVRRESSFQSLETAAKQDLFEWADYLTTYVFESTKDGVSPEVRRNAEKYAARLAEVESNSLPAYLAEYYFRVDQQENALAMLKKYAGYSSSDPNVWNEAFHLLGQYGDSETCRRGVAELMEMLEEWRSNNIGTIRLNREASLLIEAYS